MRRILATILLMFVPVPLFPQETETRPEIPEAIHDYRDNQDGRVVASIGARVERKTLIVRILTYGPAVEPPLGYHGVRGENLQTARELERHLSAGTLRTESTSLTPGEFSIVERGKFRIRLDQGTIVEETRTPDEKIRGVEYRAPLATPASGERFTVDFLVLDIPRLRLHGRIDSMGRGRLRFEPLLGLPGVPRSRSPATTTRQDPPVPPVKQDESRLREWIDQLSDDSFEVRERATAALSALGERALAEIERHLNDPDPELRERVRKIAREIRLHIAFEHLNDADPEIRIQGREEFRQSTGRELLDSLIEQPDERAALALTDFVLFETDVSIREKTQKAILAMGSPAVYPAALWLLRSNLGHENEVVKWLIQQGDGTLLPELQRLKEAGFSEATNVLKGLRESKPDLKPVEPVEWKPVDPTPFVDAIRNGKRPSDRIRGIRVVVTGLHNNPEAIGHVHAVLADRDELVRFHATEAFTFLLAFHKALPDLIRRLSDRNELLRTRQMAAVALGRNASPEAKRALLNVFDSAPPELKISLASSLAETGDPELIEPLDRFAAKETSGSIVRRALEEAKSRLQETRR